MQRNSKRIGKKPEESKKNPDESEGIRIHKDPRIRESREVHEESKKNPTEYERI